VGYNLRAPLIQMTVEAVKRKIGTMTGSSSSSVSLQLRDGSGQLAALLDDDARMLGYYSPQDGYVCVCICVTEPVQYFVYKCVILTIISAHISQLAS
jgi:Ubiquitin-like domain